MFMGSGIKRVVNLPNRIVTKINLKFPGNPIRRQGIEDLRNSFGIIFLFLFLWK